MVSIASPSVRAFRVTRAVSPVAWTAALGLVLAGCGGAVRPAATGGTTSPAGSGTARAVEKGGATGVRLPTFTPGSAPAGHYVEKERAAKPDGAIGSVALEVLLRYYAETDRPPLWYDERLAAVAEDYARSFPEKGSPSRSLIDFILRYHGIAEPFPHIAAYKIETDDPVDFREGFAGDVAELIGSRSNRRLGVGMARLPRGGFRLVLAFLPGILRLDPVPRSARPGAKIGVHGSVVSSLYASPRLVVTRSDGSVRTLEPAKTTKAGDAARFDGVVTLDTGPGRYDIEIVADGRHGPSVIGLLPVFAGSAPPAEIALTPHRGTESSADDVAREIFARVNDARDRAGLAPVAWSDRATAVARAHSEDMIRGGFIGHHSPTTGTPEDRAAAAGLPLTLVEENLCKAYSAFDAHDGLMASPGHRGVILSKGATHLGIGVISKKRPKEPTSYYVTELFVRDVPPIEPTAAVPKLVEIVNAARNAAGRRPLRADPRLHAMAAKACREHMTAGRSADATAAALGKAFAGARDDYASIATLISVVPYLEAVADTPEILGKRYAAMGAGVHEGTHPDEGAGICTIVLLAAPRPAR